MNETGNLSEKKAIEKATAEKFLTLYNAQMGTSYSIVEGAEIPESLPALNSSLVRISVEGPRMSLSRAVIRDPVL
jgi:hypothetical protein